MHSVRGIRNVYMHPHSVDLSPGAVNEINKYAQEWYILRNLNKCTCMDTKLSMVNRKPFLILSSFIMMTDKLFCTVQLPVIMKTVCRWTDTSPELGDLV